MTTIALHSLEAFRQQTGQWTLRVRRWQWPRHHPQAALLALLWCGVLATRAAQVLVVQPEAPWHQLWPGNWRSGTLPALRGRILDANGRPLAWSERRLELVYDPGAAGRQAPPAETRVVALVPAAEVRLTCLQAVARGTPATVVANLGAAQLEAVGDLLAEDPRWTLRTAYRRCYAPLPGATRRALGGTQTFGVKEVGISCFEQLYDEQLRGQDGRYTVQVDGDGQWLLRTWRELRPPNPGRDVYLPARLSPQPHP